MSATSRLAELEKNFQEVAARIQSACEASGRHKNAVSLIAVTKTWPASDIRLLHQIGQRDFGESRDQEASQKVAELSDLDLTWHFIGQVQTNKLNHIAKYADVVHALDREKVVVGLDKACAKLNRFITGLIQVSLDGDENRGGVAAEDVLALAKVFQNCANLSLGGVMAVAPLDMAPDIAFEKLHKVAQELQNAYPTAQIISAGMSSDLEEAVKNGATHVRIGSDLLGNRT